MTRNAPPSNGTSTLNPSAAATGPVMIWFEDDTIAQLFAELVETQGVKAVVIDGSQAISSPETRIVTEPRLFHSLAERLRSRCLVVGNKDALRDVKALSLSRPLTEEKIENALQAFLGC